MVVKKLGELLEDKVVYLDWRGNCEEFRFEWQSSIMNGKSLAVSVILRLGTGGQRLARERRKHLRCRWRLLSTPSE